MSYKNEIEKIIEKRMASVPRCYNQFDAGYRKAVTDIYDDMKEIIPDDDGDIDD